MPISRPCQVQYTFFRFGLDFLRLFNQSDLSPPLGMLDVASPCSIRKYRLPDCSRTSSIIRRVSSSRLGFGCRKIASCPNRSPYIQIRHVFPVHRSLKLIHLVPLVVSAVRWMNLSERFHRKEENQFEMGNLPHNRTSFKSADKSFSGCHPFGPRFWRSTTQ